MADLIATADDARAAYRLLLGREPDPKGLSDYQTLVAGGNITVAQLRSIFISSGEYASKRERKVDIGGATLVVDAEEPEFGRHIARDATWEPHIVSVIQRNLRSGDVFVDIGANVGVMSLYAALAVGPTGKVFSFEPDERNAHLLLRAVIESKFHRFVRVYRLALSDTQSIFSMAGGSNANLVSASMPVRLVQAIRGDDVLAQEPRIDFMKLDIEGYEPLAMRGLEQTIAKHKPLVLCEFNPRCLTSHAGIQPMGFAEQIFKLTADVEAIEHDGRTNHVTTPADLLSLWEAKNDHAVRTGLLPPGMLHFDLLFGTGSSLDIRL